MPLMMSIMNALKVSRSSTKNSRPQVCYFPKNPSIYESPLGCHLWMPLQMQAAIAKRSLLIDVRMILHFQPSFRSCIGRALAFKSEGCEFELHRGRELYQKDRVIFLIIEEQLSMLKFFRLCMMVTFLMSPLSKRKYGKIFPYLLFQKGRTGKAKDPLPY